MRISQTAKEAGVPARLLRYYEEQGLLQPERTSSGYRDYSTRDVAVVRQVRQLLDARLSTATIRTVLPCLTERAGRLAPICQDTIDDLQREQARIEGSIEALTRSRDAIRTVIDAAAASAQPYRQRTRKAASNSWDAGGSTPRIGKQ